MVTDWGAMNDRIEGFRAGCDLSMPGGSGYMETDVLKAVQNGTLPESTVNASARRVLELVLRRAKGKEEPCDHDAHHALARQAAEAGAVLLKNEGDLLPLREGAKIAVVGTMARQMRYQGGGFQPHQPPEAEPAAGFSAWCDLRARLRRAGGYNPGAVGRSGGCGARRRGGGGVCRFAGTV